MRKPELKRRLREIFNEQELINRKGDLSRARSVTVGTAFGGCVEIAMRSSDGTHLWVLMSQSEAIEFAHQIAAGVGCHINIKPRDDFSSWRQWNAPKSDEDTAQIPLASSAQPADSVKLSAPKKQTAKLNRSNDNVVATEKTVNRRSPKRAAKTS